MKPKHENFPPGTPGYEEQAEKTEMIEQATKSLQEKGVLPVEESVKEAEIKKALTEEKAAEVEKKKSSIMDRLKGIFGASLEKKEAKFRETIESFAQEQFRAGNIQELPSSDIIEKILTEAKEDDFEGLPGFNKEDLVGYRKKVRGGEEIKTPVYKTITYRPSSKVKWGAPGGHTFGSGQ